MSGRRRALLALVLLALVVVLRATAEEEDVASGVWADADGLHIDPQNSGVLWVNGVRVLDGLQTSEAALAAAAGGLAAYEAAANDAAAAVDALSARLSTAQRLLQSYGPTLYSDLTCADVQARLASSLAASPALWHIHGTLDLTGCGPEVLSAAGVASLARVGFVSGDVRLDGGSGTLLPALTQIGGSLRVARLGSTRLELPMLRLVGQNMSVTDSPALASLALPALHAVGGELRLHNNALTTLVGALPSLERLGALEVADEPQLANVTDAFPQLLTVSDSIVLQNLSSLVHATGLFPALLSVGRLVRIARNDNLVLLAGFEDMRVMKGSIHIEANPALTDVGEFGRGFFQVLESLGGDLKISSNSDLVTIAGFDNLAVIGGALTIELSPQLVSLSAGFASSLTATGSITLRTLGLGAVVLPQLHTATSISVIRLSIMDTLSLPGVVALDTLMLTSNNRLASANITSLERVGTLSITSNPAIIDLDWLGTLKNITGSFTATNNAVLNSLRGVADLFTQGGGFSGTFFDICGNNEDLSIPSSFSAAYTRLATPSNPDEMRLRLCGGAQCCVLFTTSCTCL